MVQRQIAFEKTIQRQEALTLSDIAPRWAKRLRELREEPDPVSIRRLRWWFEIIYPPRCVVGEAHGFTRSYTYSCRECAKIGDKFSLYYTLHLNSKLEENEQKFVNHWNKEHTQVCFVRQKVRGKNPFFLFLDLDTNNRDTIANSGTAGVICTTASIFSDNVHLLMNYNS